jgi:fatty acid desaturase
MWYFTMKNSADVRTLGIVAAKLVIFRMVWSTWSELGFFLRACCLLVQFCAAFYVATTVHNAMHCDVFSHPTIEIPWRFILTTIFGFPVEAYRPTHNANHHVFTQLEQDHLHTTQMKYQWHLMNLLMFFPTVYTEIARLENAYIAKEFAKRSWAFVRFVGQILCCHGFTAFFIYTDWKRGLMCWVVPNILAADAIVSVNMLQHDGCEAIAPGEHRGLKMNPNTARNFVGPVINWLTCNNGYHTIHHMYSNTHWSQYPALHKKHLEGVMDPSLNEQCILRYLFRTFFWPGTLPAYRRQSQKSDKAS